MSGVVIDMKATVLESEILLKEGYVRLLNHHDIKSFGPDTLLIVNKSCGSDSLFLMIL